MRTRNIVLALVCGAAVVGATWWAARPASREWSTVGSRALDELRAGQSALEKLYFLEAADHFRSALADDPNSFAAQIGLSTALLSLGQGPAADKELELALAHDPTTLSPREQRMWQVAKLRKEGRQEKLLSYLEAAAKESPGDPEITKALSSYFLGRGDLAAAAHWAQATLEVAPNDARSYNTLGYVEMGLGNFAAAEANLKRYAFIAPDQANPHDSLGELYTVLGRWDDANREFHRALEVSPRFFPAYDHLARVAALRGDDRSAVEAIEKGAEIAGMPAKEREYQATLYRALAALWRGDDPSFVGIVNSMKWPADTPQFGLRIVAAMKAGDVTQVRALEAELEAFRKVHNQDAMGGTNAHDQLVHAIVLFAEGHYTEAAQAAQAADIGLNYSEDGGVSKLLGRCLRAVALARAGHTDEAREVIASVEAVNPYFPGLSWYREMGDRKR
ncbi:MAG: tetratricopeptide repeat protein [Acidobacteriota bacterium]